MPQVRTTQLGAAESFSARPGELLLDVLRRNKKVVVAACGGKGTCGKCRVHIKGHGTVLSCRYHVEEDIEVELESLGKHLILEAPGANLKHMALDSGITLSTHDGHAIVKWQDAELGAIPAGDGSNQKTLGIAVDIGTTTVVVFLEDLASGATIDVASFVNPQTKFGHDVISRINHAIEKKDGLAELRGDIVCAISESIRDLCARNALQPESIFKTIIVGNTTMLHLFWGVDPSSIAFAPFTPAFVNARTMRGDKAGLAMSPFGIARTLPSVSGYVGADITAGIASTDLADTATFSLFIDIGTNGEMAVGNRDVIYCCATAAGPAFEGAKISCGIGGVVGAISHFSDGRYTTIGGTAPAGICGSGLLDIVAALVKSGVIDYTGYMDKDFVVERAANTLSGRDIVLTPADVREVQLAKAAIRAGIRVLLCAAQLSHSSIDHVYLAGAFGNYMRVDSAVAVGLLPRELSDKVVQVGNSAGNGALLALRSVPFEREVDSVTRRCKYIELSMRKDFNDAYVEAMMFDNG